ncbi:MAG: porin [Methylococcaceae bacterium]|nr:porin [Methylococcaceae bacterium]MCI0734181.1 porin [Methylococcaceae bacterium]
MKIAKHRLSASALALGLFTSLGAQNTLADPIPAEEPGTTSAESAPKDWTNADGLLEAMGANINDAQFMKNWNLKFGGWIETSVSGNTNNSPDGFNGTITFNDRTGEIQMNQFYLFIQKAIEVNGDSFDLGGRFDFLYGSDAIFTQAFGVPAFDPQTGLPLNRGHWDLHLTSHNDRFYSIALPQAYAELNLPVGNGLTVKAGHFYTPIGYEVVTAPDNFFVTKPYTFQYGEPFTHTGFLAGYTFNSNWSVMAGAVTGSATGGWDGNWDQQLGNWDFLGGVTWTSDDGGSSLGLTASAGERSENSSSAWAIYSIVGKHDFTENLHYVFQHDHGFADNVITANTIQNGTTEDASWYGINQYLFYDIQENLSAGIRAEWWRDANGFRVAGPARCGASLNVDNTPAGFSTFACGPNNFVYPFAASDYYALTLGLTYKPVPWILLRPNLRYDHADIPAFDAGQRHNQFLITGDLVVIF